MTQALARPPARPVPSLRDVVLRAALAIAFLIPATVLFGQVWNAKSATSDTIAKELDGLAYLRAITPVTTTLTAAESVAVNGDTVDYGSVDRAMQHLQDVDAHSDAAPGAHPRFAGLLLKVQQLHTAKLSNPQDAYSAYSAVTELVLALAQEVRQESGLIRDQQADVYYIEDGATWQLPTSVVSAGRYGDLVAIAINQSASQRQQTIGQIVAARASILASAQTLGDDVDLAVEATASRTLSGDVVAKLDRFRLAIDSLVPPASMPNQLPSTSDRSLALGDKAKVQVAATDLSDALLNDAQVLLNDRASNIRQGQELAILTYVLAILIALAPVTIAGVRRRRSRASFSGPSQHGDAGTPSTVHGRSDPAHAAPHADRSSRARELSGVPL